MPEPRAGESKQDFVSRCMGSDEMQKYDQDQRAAICYSKYGLTKSSDVCYNGDMMTVQQTIRKIQKSLAMKAEEGQKKMIFGKPYTYSGGQWVQDDSPSSATDDAPDTMSPQQAEEMSSAPVLVDGLTQEQVDQDMASNPLYYQRISNESDEYLQNQIDEQTEFLAETDPGSRFDKIHRLAINAALAEQQRRESGESGAPESASDEVYVSDAVDTAALQDTGDSFQNMKNVINSYEQAVRSDPELAKYMLDEVMGYYEKGMSDEEVIQNALANATSTSLNEFIEIHGGDIDMDDTQMERGEYAFTSEGRNLFDLSDEEYEEYLQSIR